MLSPPHFSRVPKSLASPKASVRVRVCFLAAYVDEARRAFLLMDLNRDEAISQAELRAGLASLGLTLSGKQLAKSFAIADADASGEIDFDEFRAMGAELERRGAHAPLDAEDLVCSLAELGGLFLALGMPDDAAPLLKAAFSRAEEIADAGAKNAKGGAKCAKASAGAPPPAHWGEVFAWVAATRAAQLVAAGRPRKAERCMRRALEMREGALTPHHPLVAATLSALARAKLQTAMEMGKQLEGYTVALRSVESAVTASTLHEDMICDSGDRERDVRDVYERAVVASARRGVRLRRCRGGRPCGHDLAHPSSGGRRARREGGAGGQC